MERIILRPSRFRGGALIEDRGDPLELTWGQACERLAPDEDRRSWAVIRNARAGNHIGVRTKNGRKTTFLLATSVSDSDVRWLMKRIPDFAETVDEIFRVEQVAWEAAISEPAA